MSTALDMSKGLALATTPDPNEFDVLAYDGRWIGQLRNTVQIERAGAGGAVVHSVVTGSVGAGGDRYIVSLVFAGLGLTPAVEVGGTVARAGKPGGCPDRVGFTISGLARRAAELGTTEKAVQAARVEHARDLMEHARHAAEEATAIYHDRMTDWLSMIVAGQLAAKEARNV